MTTVETRKLNSFMWIVGICVSVFCGAGLTVALSYGSTKNTVEQNCQDILTLQRTSVHYLYMQDLIESNQRLIAILESTPGSEEKKIALKEWSEFQDRVTRRANPTRGGYSPGPSTQ